MTRILAAAVPVPSHAATARRVAAQFARLGQHFAGELKWQ